MTHLLQWKNQFLIQVEKTNICKIHTLRISFLFTSLSKKSQWLSQHASKMYTHSNSISWLLACEILVFLYCMSVYVYAVGWKKDKKKEREGKWTEREEVGGDSEAIKNRLSLKSKFLRTGTFNYYLHSQANLKPTKRKLATNIRNY